MDDWLELAWRPFAFRLPRQLVTAHGALVEKRGWLRRRPAAGGYRYTATDDFVIPERFLKR